MTEARIHFSWFELAAALLGSCVLLFIIAPLLSLTLACSGSELSQAVADAEVTASLRLTLCAAALAAVVSSLVGVPLAYLLARKRFWGRSLVLAIVDLPIVIPHTAAGLALLTVIGRQSVLGAQVGSLVGTEAGTAVAMGFVSIPFLINAARAGFEAVPERLEKVARTLGASPSRAFFTIALPLAWRGIFSGLILMWARGISEFGAVVIIAYHPLTTPTLLFERFNTFGLTYARSAAVLLLLTCVALFIVLRFVARTPKERERSDA